MESERFIQLLTLKYLNELTDADRDEFNALIKSNPELRAKCEIYKQFWKRRRVSLSDNIAMFDNLKTRIDAEEALKYLPVVQSNAKAILGKRRSFKVWYAAASVLFFVASIMFLYRSGVLPLGSGATIEWHQAATKSRLKKMIRLSDGTIATLNSGTILRYPAKFNENIREVYLDGEAFFDVHKDHKHPFIIHTKKMNVRVLGTAFNVKSYSSEPISETTLIRGSVEVTLNDRPSDRIILKPKEKLTVRYDSDTKKSKNLPGIPGAEKGASSYSLTNLTYYPNKEKTVIETSWVENKLTFTNKDFVQLSVMMERWYGARFQFANDQLKLERFSGIFEKENLPEALDALRLVTPFRYKIKDSTVYIY